MADNEVSVTARDIENLVDWMRKSGRPQTIKTLARHYVEMLREEHGIRDTVQKSKEHHLNMGITPYRGSQSTSVQHYSAQHHIDLRPHSSGQSYFETNRYKGFERYLQRAAIQHNIKVEGLERVEGIWEGKSEPAISIWLRGKREDIIELADNLGAKYNQSAVLLFEPDDEAEGFIYRITLLDKQERHVAMIALTEHGISGARLTSDANIEIADPDGSLVRQVIALAQALNATLTYSRGHVILREKNIHYGTSA